MAAGQSPRVLASAATYTECLPCLRHMRLLALYKVNLTFISYLLTGIAVRFEHYLELVYIARLSWNRGCKIFLKNNVSLLDIFFSDNTSSCRCSRFTLPWKYFDRFVNTWFLSTLKMRWSCWKLRNRSAFLFWTAADQWQCLRFVGHFLRYSHAHWR